MRFDLYGPSHKGIRAALAQLRLHAGQLNFALDSEVNNLLIEMRSLWEFLEFHAAGEDELIHHHLERANKVVFDAMESDHYELTTIEKTVLVELEVLVKVNSTKRIAPGAIFVKNLNDYIARYLMHLQREELEAMPILWDSLDDPTPAAIVGKFSAKANSQLMQYFTKFLIPSINHYERVGMFSGIKAGLPEPVFKSIMMAAKAFLSEENYQDLDTALSTN